MPSPVFREPRKITDLAEFASDYIDFMRVNPQSAVCDWLIDYAASFFRDIPVSDKQLDSLALMLVDHVYRYAGDLKVKDGAVTLYFSKVTRYLLDVLASRGARIFYILDNEIRQDRFDLAIELMFRSGVFVVTPYRVDGSVIEFSDVRLDIEIQVIAGRHVAYIEKDASVNYLSLVVEIARATDWYVIFRNHSPDNPHVEHIASRRVTQSA